MVNDQVGYIDSSPIVTHCSCQVAGYVTEYDENNFRFVTVKGSGHMVSLKILHDC